MSIKYIAIENGSVLLFKDDSKVPFLVQTSWPSGRPWTSLGEMHFWGKMKVAEFEEENAPYAPSFPGESVKAKPTKDAIENAFSAVRSAETPADRLTALSDLSQLQA
jgi:hypothetical protein